MCIVGQRRPSEVKSILFYLDPSKRLPQWASQFSQCTRRQRAAPLHKILLRVYIHEISYECHQAATEPTYTIILQSKPSPYAFGWKSCGAVWSHCISLCTIQIIPQFAKEAFFHWLSWCCHASLCLAQLGVFNNHYTLWSIFPFTQPFVLCTATHICTKTVGALHALEWLK